MKLNFNLREFEELLIEGLDISLSYLVMLLLIPLLILVAFWYLLEDGGPPIFKSLRVGLNERLFLMDKLRTMRRGAFKDRLGAYTVENDPRETRVGKFLRRWSLDELPQAFNVLKGEMSFVGPRPAIPSRHLSFSEEARKLRVSVKPGITGLAQLSGRNAISWEKRLELDLEYVKRRSFPLNLKLILMTPVYVLKGEGIYYSLPGELQESGDNVK